MLGGQAAAGAHAGAPGGGIIAVTGVADRKVVAGRPSAVMGRTRDPRPGRFMVGRGSPRLVSPAFDRDAGK